MILTSVRFAVAATIVVAALASPVRGQGAVTDLAATIVSVEPCNKGAAGAIVTMKVANRGKAFAEPLVFEIAPKGGGSAVVLRRCPGPYVGRSGRPAPPGGAQTYQIFQAGAHALLTGAKAKVIDASFSSAAPPPHAQIEVGRPRTDKRVHERGATVEYAILPLRNQRDLPVDVTVRVTFERPLAETILVHRRLKPLEAVEASFTDLVYEPPGPTHDEGDNAAIDLVVPRGARIGAAKVVDWCWIESGEGDDAPRLFREAYARWLRWDGTPCGVSGTWTATVRPEGGAPRSSRGAFGFSAEGVVSCHPEGATAEDAARIKRAISDAFSDLRRPPPDEAVALLQPRMERTGPPALVTCPGDGWPGGAYGRTTFAIENGRLIGHDWMGGEPADPHCDWRLEAFEGGYVVAGRDAYTIGGRKRPTATHRWRYIRIEGLLTPRRYAFTEDLAPVAEPWTLELDFHDVKPDAAAAAPVASPATEIVRAAWNSGYRYPGTRIACQCRFSAKAGKDGVWYGVKAVKGRIAFAEWDCHGGGSCVVEVDGVTDERLRRMLAFTIQDRLTLWTGRDFAARGTFDSVFAGAAFAEQPASPGTFDVTNGPYRSVKIEDGRVVALTFPDGALRKLFWTKVGEQHVVTRVTTGTEDVGSTYVPAGPLLVPSRMVYKGVFGGEREWGTEELALTDFSCR